MKCNDHTIAALQQIHFQPIRKSPMASIVHPSRRRHFVAFYSVSAQNALVTGVCLGGLYNSHSSCDQKADMAVWRLVLDFGDEMW